MGQLTDLDTPQEYVQPRTQPFDAEAFLKKHKAWCTKERYDILLALAKKPWFKATHDDLQDTLARLPQTGNVNHNGFLTSLIRRKTKIGGIEVRKLLQLGRGDFLATPVFEVENTLTKQIYAYDYMGHMQGVPAGAKGLVFVRKNKKSTPTHFIILSGEKFALSENVYDLIGGRNEEGELPPHFTKTIIREVREETGVNKLEIDEIMSFGPYAADPGLTSSQTILFAAFVTPKEAAKIDSHAKNIDDLELNHFVHTLPIKEISTVAQKTKNGLVLAVITKAVAHGIVPTKYLHK